MSSSIRHRRRSQHGFSLIELLIVIAIILIILSIALPQMSKSRMNAQEMAAIAEIGTINKQEIQYYSQYNQYATSLAQLGPPATTGAAEGPQAAGLIPGSLASGTAVDTISRSRQPRPGMLFRRFRRPLAVPDGARSTRTRLPSFGRTGRRNPPRTRVKS